MMWVALAASGELTSIKSPKTAAEIEPPLVLEKQKLLQCRQTHKRNELRIEGYVQKIEKLVVSSAFVGKPLW